MSVATVDHAAGTAMPSWRKTVEPSGFLISDTRVSKSIPAYGLWPSWVKRRGILIPTSSLHAIEPPNPEPEGGQPGRTNISNFRGMSSGRGERDEPDM